MAGTIKGIAVDKVARLVGQALKKVRRLHGLWEIRPFKPSMVARRTTMQ
jgi:hypothetical protein